VSRDAKPTMAPGATPTPPGPADDFYPRPIELGELRRRAVNVRDLGDGVEVVVVPDGDRLRIFREICPHMGGPLSQATVCDNDTLECPWHGYRFSVESGRLVDNPNERIMAELRRRAPACFKPESAPKYALTRMAYTVADGRAYVHRRRGGT